jgi:DNA-binding MarR family transcriptional regulator
MVRLMAKRKQGAVSSLETHAGFWLRFVSNHVSSRFKRLVEARGVTVSDWVALRTLLERQATTHSDLIEALGMTKGAASKVVTRLEQKGLATRRTAEGRAREQLIEITAAGRRLVPELAALADENDAHFFACLSRSEHEAVLGVLQKLVRVHELKTVPVE